MDKRSGKSPMSAKPKLSLPQGAATWCGASSSSAIGSQNNATTISNLWTVCPVSATSTASPKELWLWHAVWLKNGQTVKLAKRHKREQTKCFCQWILIASRACFSIPEHRCYSVKDARKWTCQNKCYVESIPRIQISHYKDCVQWRQSVARQLQSVRD